MTVLLILSYMVLVVALVFAVGLLFGPLWKSDTRDRDMPDRERESLKRGTPSDGSPEVEP